MLKAMKNHPWVQKALARGEERVGHVVAQLLSSPRTVAALQALAGATRGARERLQGGAARTLRALGVPSSDEVEELRRKLERLEEQLSVLSSETEGPSSREGKGR